MLREACIVNPKRIGETMVVGMEGRRQVSAKTDNAENSFLSRLPESTKNLAEKPPIRAQAYSVEAPPRLAYFQFSEGV